MGVAWNRMACVSFVACTAVLMLADCNWAEDKTVDILAGIDVEALSTQAKQILSEKPRTEPNVYPKVDDDPNQNRMLWLVVLTVLRDEFTENNLKKLGFLELKQKAENEADETKRKALMKSYREQMELKRPIAALAAEESINEAMVINGHEVVDFRQVDAEFSKLAAEYVKETIKQDFAKAATEIAKPVPQPPEEEFPEAKKNADSDKEKIARESRANGKLSLARQYKRLNKTDKARVILKQLSKEYPDTDAGREAIDELKSSK